MQLCKPDPICRDPDLPIPVTPIPDVVVILDDAVARRVAEALGLPLIAQLSQLTSRNAEFSRFILLEGA
jgi:hypothetical protein